MAQAFGLAFQAGLQGFLIVGVALAVIRALGSPRLELAVQWGLALSIPGSLAAGYLFLHTSRQAEWETALAVSAFAVVAWLGALVRRARRREADGSLPSGAFVSPPRVLWAAALATSLFVIRQEMETVALANVMLFQLRSLAGMSGILLGTFLAATIAWAWARVGPRLDEAKLLRAAGVFRWAFLAQLGIYAFHELTEAALPYTEHLHLATEPYSPDGMYGQYLSYVLVALPALSLVLPRRMHAATGIEADAWDEARMAATRPGRRVAFAAVAAGGVLALIGFSAAGWRGGNTLEPPASASAVDVLAAPPAAPQIAFRSTARGDSFGRLSLAPLAAPGGARYPTGLACDRVYVAAGQGLCLATEWGFFTSYVAHTFDSTFERRHTFSLDGMPSRVRLSADGRMAAITVFVSGHSYTSGFSTRTTLVDVAAGTTLGDLEAFTVWREGRRIQSADFNFWGVTFARDARRFYATLATGGTTYLIEGDLALRRVQVLRENVECPSLSPDETRVAFKRRVLAKGRSTWGVAVLDLRNGSVQDLRAERRSIDDQIEWLDESHLLYAVPENETPEARRDIWRLRADGSEPPSMWVPHAESPAVLRSTSAQAQGSGGLRVHGLRGLRVHRLRGGSR